MNLVQTVLEICISADIETGQISADRVCNSFIILLLFEFQWWTGIT